MARISRSTVSRVEAAAFDHLSIREAVVIADAVGLNVSFRTFPGRSRRATRATPTSCSGCSVTSVHPFDTQPKLLSRRAMERPSNRAWDAMIFGMDGDTGVELEMRLYDLQAQFRRVHLKFRDSGADRLLLLIADTSANRRVLRTIPEYFADLPRLRTATALVQLQRGDRPPTGHVLI